MTFYNQLGLPMTRLAELASIILCTCFPMMPRLLKLISDRRAKSKYYSTSPLGQASKRKIAIAGKRDDSGGAGGASSDGTEEWARLERPYEQAWGPEDVSSGGSRGSLRYDDIELAMPGFEIRHFSDVLDQRLNMEFTLPSLSYS